MEFEQRADGTRVPLPMQSVDTGMGLERLTSVIQQVPTNYDTDLFTPIHAAMRDLLGHDPEAFEAERFSYQVIADHSRAVTFLVADGVAPSNEGRGYVLRRILRRAVRHGRLLGRREPFMDVTAGVVIDVMKDAYPYLVEQRETDPEGHPPGGGPVRPDSRDGHEPPRGRAGAADRRPSGTIGRLPDSPARETPRSARRGRLPAPRHLRLPGRSHRRHGRRVRRPGRSRRLRRRDGRAEGAQPQGHQSRPGAPRRTGRPVPGHPATRRRDEVPRLRRHGGRGAGRRHPARRDGIRRS